jgi:hypothetical protein
MPYTFKNSKGELYYLHSAPAGKNSEGALLYFAKSRGENVLDDLPEDFKVIESDRTGLPVVKRKQRDIQ